MPALLGAKARQWHDKPQILFFMDKDAKFFQNLSKLNPESYEKNYTL